MTVASARIAIYLSDILGFPQEFFEPTTPIRFIWRYGAAVALSSMLFLTPFLTVIPSLATGSFPFIIVSTGISIALSMLFFPVALWFALLSLSFLPAIVITILFWVCSALLLLIRGMLERVLEYQKGVFAAFVLVVATVLSVIELLSKHIK